MGKRGEATREGGEAHCGGAKAMNCMVSGGLRARVLAVWRREVGRAARVRSRRSRGIYRGSQGSKYGRGSPGVTSPDRARSRHREKRKEEEERRKEEGDVSADVRDPPVGA